MTVALTLSDAEAAILGHVLSTVSYEVMPDEHQDGWLLLQANYLDAEITRRTKRAADEGAPASVKDEITGLRAWCDQIRASLKERMAE